MDYLLHFSVMCTDDTLGNEKLIQYVRRVESKDGGNDLHVCARVKAGGHQRPVVFVTIDRSIDLEDYIIEPLRLDRKGDDERPVDRQLENLEYMLGKEGWVRSGFFPVDTSTPGGGV